MSARFSKEMLSLRAEDEEDFSVISAFLQDSLVRLCDVTYLKNEQQFIMVIHRLVREGRLTESFDGVPEARVQTGLCFEAVRSVHVRGISQEERNIFLRFLTVAYSGDEISLIFDQDGVIRLCGNNMICLFRDLGVTPGADGPNV